MNVHRIATLTTALLLAASVATADRYPIPNKIVEVPDHPFFIASQFHPELKSRPDDPHPLFVGFVAAALRHKQGEDVSANVSDRAVVEPPQ